MDADLEVLTFNQAAEPSLTEAVQRLRYAVYHHDLGLDTPDMDHVRGVDVEDNDLRCDCVIVKRAGDIVGCLRLQPSGRGAFYAEKEFTLLGPTWKGARFVEGARFAVRPQDRHGGAAIRLFAAFRDYCRAHDISRLISVCIVSDAERRPAVPAGILRWLLSKGVRFALDRGRPAPGYEHDLSGAAAAWLDPASLPPMMHMLANPRTTLSSAPAYCRRFDTWNFLLVTQLRRKP